MQAVPIEQWLASYTPPERLVQSGRKLLDRYVAAKQRKRQTERLHIGSRYVSDDDVRLLIGVYSFGHLMMATPNTPKLYQKEEVLHR
ncbi:MAG: hypothetical protein R3C05_13865 [Pirellulaceae bacterium]